MEILVVIALYLIAHTKSLVVGLYTYTNKNIIEVLIVLK